MSGLYSADGVVALTHVSVSACWTVNDSRQSSWGLTFKKKLGLYSDISSLEESVLNRLEDSGAGLHQGSSAVWYELLRYALVLRPCHMGLD